MNTPDQPFDYAKPHRESDAYQASLWTGLKSGWVTDQFFLRRVLGEDTWDFCHNAEPEAWYPGVFIDLDDVI